MSKRTTRRPELFNDPDGTCCVRVPLGDGHSFAELYADDYAALLARGVSGNWQITVPNRLSRKMDRPAFRRHPDAIIHGNDRGVYGQQQAVHG